MTASVKSTLALHSQPGTASQRLFQILLQSKHNATVPWDKDKRALLPPSGTELVLIYKTLPGKQALCNEGRKTRPQELFRLLVEVQDAFIEHCLWFSCRVLKRLTYVMWQNLHMLQWKSIPGGCIFKRSWVIMLPFPHIYWIWCVQLCVQKTNQDSKVMWNTTKYAGKVNKGNFITF